MKVAPRPETRTVEVHLDGRFAGWQITARADFRAGLLGDLQSGQVAKIIAALDEITIRHNFPNTAGELAASMADVDPYGGVIEAGIQVVTAIGKLPNG